MYLYRVALVLNLVCLFVSSAIGQTAEKPGKISGKIINEQKKPVEYATVTLLKPDSSVVNGGLTDDNGNFQIEQTGTGKFLLRISGIGFVQRTIGDIEIRPEALDKKQAPITVKSSSTVMQEVQITGERRVMELAVDKKVFNVEKNITTAGGSAADVLQNVPAVAVDVDGTVSLRGKSNVTLLIDGKPATLLGGDAASALQALPGSSIESVEVITNPSAKYDAQGMGGIINIVTKKDRRFGLNGSVTAGAGTRDKYNGGINLNARNEKWNVFFNSNFRKNRNYHRTTTERNNLNGAYYNTYENNMRTFGGWFNTIGGEYTINDKNSITLTENLNLMQWGGNAVSTYRVYNTDGLPEFMQRRVSDNVGGPFSTSTSLDFKHKFNKPKQELTTNVTFATTRVQREQHYTTYGYDSSETEVSRPVYQDAPGGGGNKSLNGQADFTTPFATKNGKLDAGWKSQLLWFESSNNPTIDSGTGKQVDVLLLNDYDYSQHVHAAYTSYSDQYKNWSFNGGLRLEYATYEGTARASAGKRYSNDYLGLFPSAFISYKLSKEQAIYLSYTRRTDRPGFWRLMPYLDLSNPQDTSMGNPDLLPEFIHNTELNYSRQFGKGHTFIASAYYQYTQNLIERYRVFYANGTTFSQPRNLNSGVTYGLELTGRAQILPIWDVTASANLFQNEVRGTNIDPTLNNSGFSWFSKANTNLKLPGGFSLQVNGNYEAPKVVAQGRTLDAWWLDVALRKNLLNNKATLVVNVSDIFNTRKFTTLYDMPLYTQSVYRDRETRIGNISFTYRFGKSDMRSQSGGRRGRNNNAVPEKDRNNLKTDDNAEQGGF